MEDSAPLNIESNTALIKLATSAICGIKYKSLLFLFIIFLFMTSDVFANTILKKIKGSVDDRGIATPYGTVIQGFALIICFMIVNFFIEKELL